MLNEVAYLVRPGIKVMSGSSRIESLEHAVNLIYTHSGGFLLSDHISGAVSCQTSQCNGDRLIRVPDTSRGVFRVDMTG